MIWEDVLSVRMTDVKSVRLKEEACVSDVWTQDLSLSKDSVSIAPENGESTQTSVPTFLESADITSQLRTQIERSLTRRETTNFLWTTSNLVGTDLRPRRCTQHSRDASVLRSVT